MNRDEWDQRYRSGNLPWDRATPSEHLAWAIEQFAVAPGKAVVIGCGTGTNAIWLARQGFAVTGVDISQRAVEMARAKAGEAGVEGTFAAVDFLHEAVGGGPFAFAFDRGCFHSVDTGDDQATFARRVAALLAPGGLWLSVSGSTDAPPRDAGPPQVSAREIVLAVEDHFEVLLLQADFLRNDKGPTFPAWRCVMRKRPPKPAGDD